MQFILIMKIYLLLFLFLAFIPLASADINTPQVSGLKLTFPKERITAPDFTLPLLDNKLLSLSHHKGKLIVLNFWATFCSPCREEMPALQMLWEKYSDKGLVIIAVTVDQTDKKIIQGYIKKSKITFPVVLDRNANIRKQYEVNALPMTYIIGRDRKFIAKAIGFRDWSTDDNFIYFEKLLLNN